MALTLLQLFDGPAPTGAGSSTFTYIIADQAAKQALIIDPVLEQAERDLAEVAALDCVLTHALNTHCHADHITGSGRLKAEVPELITAISAASNAQADMRLTPGQPLTWGAERSLHVLATPGHTNGCLSFYDESLGAVFTGDALLIGGCGRTDFQEGSAETLYESVHGALFTLPEATIVYPAHDYKGRTQSTIGEQKSSNPRLTKPKDEFVELMANLGLAYPKKIDVAVPANLVCGIGF